MHQPDDAGDPGFPPDEFIRKHGPRKLVDELIALELEGYSASPTGFLNRSHLFDVTKQVRVEKLDRILRVWLRKQIRLGHVQLSGIVVEREETENGVAPQRDPSFQIMTIDPRVYCAHFVKWFDDWVIFELDHPLRAMLDFDPVKSRMRWELLKARVRLLRPANPAAILSEAAPPAGKRRSSHDHLEADMPFLLLMQGLKHPTGGIKPLRRHQAARSVAENAWRQQPRTIEGNSENAAYYRLARNYLRAFPEDR